MIDRQCIQIQHAPIGQGQWLRGVLVFSVPALPGSLKPGRIGQIGGVLNLNPDPYFPSKKVGFLQSFLDFTRSYFLNS